MPIASPIVLQIASGVYAVNEFGLDTVFVVTGQTDALVIDTGMGCCDLRAIVDRITSLPYQVALTHGHVDHCGGWDLFNEVYLHPADRDAALAVSRERRVESAERMRGLEGDADVWAYTAEQARPWERTPAIRALADGMSFPLGGRTVTTVCVPGHSPGSCAFIDDQSRILFSGDACNVSLRVTDCPVETALAGLRNLKSHEAEFDRNFNSHMGFSSGMAHVSMPQSTLDDCIAACERVLSGRALPVATARSAWGDKPQVCSYLYGAITLTYRPDRLGEVSIRKEA